jgi:hypothetical protein
VWLWIDSHASANSWRQISEKTEITLQATPRPEKTSVTVTIRTWAESLAPDKFAVLDAPVVPEKTGRFDAG